MAKFRKKPVVVEAEQYVRLEQYIPGVCYFDCDNRDTAHIHTLEGTQKVNLNDWIITDSQGEKEPMRPNIFATIYEPDL